MYYGGEFLNETLVAYCVGQGIELTRSRPYRKNDQAWVEQKNGSVVRRLVGYRRLEGTAAAAILARLYTASRLFVNFFQPSFKLKEKFRVGGRTVKRYDPPQTPCARLLAAPTTPAVKERLVELLETLDPLRLLEEIRQAQHQLASLADGGPAALPAAQNHDLQRFLMSLSTAWHAGEVRPTDRPRQRAPHHWRTRKDPLLAHGYGLVRGKSGRNGVGSFPPSANQTSGYISRQSTSNAATASVSMASAEGTATGLWRRQRCNGLLLDLADRRSRHGMTKQFAMDVVVMDDKIINVSGVPEVTAWSRLPLLEHLRASAFPERAENALELLPLTQQIAPRFVVERKFGL